MNIPSRHLVVLAATLGFTLATSFAQQSAKTPIAMQGSKEEAHARMSVIQQEIDLLRAQFGTERRIAALTAEQAAISASLGGDLPLGAPQFGAQAIGLPPAPVVATTCNGVVPTTTNFVGTNGPITPPTPTEVTLTSVVAGAGAFLWDLNLNLNITHTASGDLDITLESPSGTIVTITTDNGGTFDNVFAGTTFDENVNAPTTDRVYANLVVATPLSAEGRLTAFRGENPNGTWKLLIRDDAAANTGTVNSWSLDISTLPSAPVATTTNFNSSPGLVISPTGTSTVMDTIPVSGLATYLEKVTLRVEILHTFNGDLSLTLTSPGGIAVIATTRNAGTNENVFNGTTFDPASSDPVTDHAYEDFVLVPTIGPEGSFDNFLGIDPNGTWTLTIADLAGGDGGTVVRWDLDISTSAPVVASAPVNYAGTTGAIPEFVTPVLNPTVYTVTVVGAGTYLHDIDVTTAITHTAAADIDMTLTSPSGTTVTLTTDNGLTTNDVFNGTLWDDNANDPVTDHVFTTATLASPLSPEGRLAAFRGENPNGVWTLTITDDVLIDNGALNSWSLGVSTIPGAPGTSTANFNQSPGLAISATGTPVVADTMAVSGIGTSIAGLTLRVEITHTFNGDLILTLTSPGGTSVIATSRNAGTSANVFNGTTFDPNATGTVTDHVYTDLVVVPVLAPEGSFDNFLGENPNGNWTLTVADMANADGGNFVRWDLNVTTCANSTPCIAFCFGDGAGTACPCGNVGAPGNGCPHSLNPAGANVSCSGLASISADSFTLNGSGMPSTAPCLYFQGTLRLGGGNGVPFGDGLRCAGGSLVRLLTKTNVGGASIYPGPGEIPISIRGNNVAGNVRQYQVWYRNAAAFCTAATFNLTNGVETTWIP